MAAVKLNKLKKSLVAIICIGFVLASFLSASFVITHEHHQCTGDGCVVCCQLENAKNTLKQFGMSGASSLSFLPVLIFLIVCAIRCFPNIKIASLVTLKIRMND